MSGPLDGVRVGPWLERKDKWERLAVGSDSGDPVVAAVWLPSCNWSVWPPQEYADSIGHGEGISAGVSRVAADTALRKLGAVLVDDVQVKDPVAAERARIVARLRERADNLVAYPDHNTSGRVMDKLNAQHRILTSMAAEFEMEA